MTITELPFFVLLIIILLPLTVGLIIFSRVLNMVREMLIRRKNEKAMVSLADLGEFLLFLAFFNVIINTILYIIGQQPEDFDIFTYLIVDQLPNVWYMLLLYGILIQLSMIMGRVKKL